MSKNYDPDSGAIPNTPYTVGFLSQRDLGLKVPINFISQSGVSLSSACFPNLIFEDASFKKCVANLLAAGIKRFQVDLYWDSSRTTWSFCPVSFSTNTSSTLRTTTTIATPSSSTLAPQSMKSTSMDAEASGGSLSPVTILGRQVATTSLSSLMPGTNNKARTSSVSTKTIVASEPEISFPPYTCTTTVNLPILVNILTEYIQQTENTLAAHLIYIIINMHAAASRASPTLPAPSPGILPGPSALLGSLFSSNLSEYLYTPSNLLSERVDINNSWYTVPEMYRPATGYYSTTSNQYGILSTEDGWPSESYVEFSKSRRLLLGFGTVDPQMSKYNFTGDDDTIFPAGYIQANATVTASADDKGNITSGCFLNSNLTNLTIGDNNSSWATSSSALNFDYSTVSTNITDLLNLTETVIACGISPLLNTTLLNLTAYQNPMPYLNYSYSTIWSWAPNEPKNYTSEEPGNDALFRCARTSLTTAHGRWHVSDCSNRNYAACRIPSQPYNWTLTTYQTSYSYASAACPSPYEFSVPRTALENAYLHQTILTLASKRDFDTDDGGDGTGGGAWVDFNSLDIKGCWVEGGVNATCPYGDNAGVESEIMRRQILVPTVAAIIVLVITMLTVFSKGVGNSRVKRKRKRRGSGSSLGFYEGVPS